MNQIHAVTEHTETRLVIVHIIYFPCTKVHTVVVI